MSEKNFAENPTLDVAGALEAMKARKAARQEAATLEDTDNADDSAEETSVADNELDRQSGAPEGSAEEETGLAAEGDGAEDQQEAAAEEPTELTELPATLSALAEEIGADEQYLRTLQVTVEKDGETRDVSLDEALAEVAGESETAKARQEIEAERQTLEQDRAAIQQQKEQIQTLLTNFDTLFPDEGEEDLDRILEEEGEAAYIRAVRNKELTSKAKEKSKAEAQATLDQLNQQQLTQLQGQAVKENTHFRQVNSLSDDKLYSSEMDETVKFLRSEGFSDDQINLTVDSRMWTIALKAMRFDRASKTASKAQKKLKKLPKIKSGTGEVKRKAVPDSVARAKARALKTGNPRDAAAFLRASRAAKQ